MQNYRQLIDIKTSSTHKELTYSEIKRFDQDVTAMVKQLEEYYPSGCFDGSARIFGTGVEVDTNMVKGLLEDAERIGEINFKSFVEERLFSHDDATIYKLKSIFDPIKKIITGL